MKIRGDRECVSCGTRWSYYETGAIACPGCGELQSVGRDDPTEHTDVPVSLDLTPVRGAVDEEPLETVAAHARELCRDYLRRRGFINRGQLRPVDEQFLLVAELTHVAAKLEGEPTVADDAELYFLELLAASNRPATGAVPDSLAAARTESIADALDRYRRELRRWCRNQDLPPLARATVNQFDAQVTRLQHLAGGASLESLEVLVQATRSLALGLDGDDAAIVEAHEQLDGLEVG